MILEVYFSDGFFILSIIATSTCNSLIEFIHKTHSGFTVCSFCPSALKVGYQNKIEPDLDIGKVSYCIFSMTFRLADLVQCAQIYCGIKRDKAPLYNI